MAPTEAKITLIKETPLALIRFLVRAATALLTVNLILRFPPILTFVSIDLLLFELMRKRQMK